MINRNGVVTLVSTILAVMCLTGITTAQDKKLPDITELMNQVRSNQANITKLLENYSYIEEDKELQKDAKGNVTVKNSETYHMTFYKGHRIRRLIAKDGKPLKTDDEQDELKKVEKKINKIDKGKSAEKVNPSISDILIVSMTLNPRYEQYNNRECIVFDFKPNPKSKPKTKLEKVAHKLGGTMWIDPEDKQVAKVDARFIKSHKIAAGLFATIKQGSMIIVEQARINNEIWLPSQTSVQLPIKVFMVKTIQVNKLITYSDYQRFNVKSEKEKLIDPEQF